MVSADVNVTGFLIIRTNKYAGNFERAMTAYCTGQLGECGVGDDEIDGFSEQFAIHAAEQGYDGDPDYGHADYFSNYVTSRPDDHGCHRPCSMSLNADHEYNDVVIFFDTRPREEDLEFILCQAIAYGKREKIKILGAEFFERKIRILDKSVWSK